MTTSHASNGSRLRRIANFGAFALVTGVALLGALALRYEGRIPDGAWQLGLIALPYLIVARLIAWHRLRLDRVYWAHVGIRDVVRLAAASTVSTAVSYVALVLGDAPAGSPLPALLALECLLTILITSALWTSARWRHEQTHQAATESATRALIVGAGSAGEQLLRQLQHDARLPIEIVGLVDDDADKMGRTLHGVPVLGTVDELRMLAAIHRVSVALVAIPSITPEQLRRLVVRCREAGLELKLLPPLRDLIAADVKATELRDVRLEDLLGRAPIELDLSAVRRDVAGQVVLVTGAAGSIGSELVRQLAASAPRTIVLVDRAESPLYLLQVAMSTAYPGVRFVGVLGSVTNAARLDRVFQHYRPDLVFHAAAYKQLPVLESNVVEGLWNNVIGTLNTARSAARCGSRRFVLISTDKAVRPSSVLGVTKLLAERVVLELPSLRSSATDFRVVRFGNVLGSEGSVVPRFAQQLAAGGPLTVTHPEVRRYFMTIPEAVQLVLQASVLDEAAGRIALLEMGTQVRILELAEQMIHLAGRVPYEDVDIVFTGLRPGEKLEEELVAPGESTTATSISKIQLVERPAPESGDLARRLRQITALAARGDEAALVRALASLAPEYQPEL